MRTIYGIVGSIEIRHQNSLEVLQQRLNDVSLSTLGKDIYHLPHVGQNPYVCQMSFDIGSRFVGVNELAMNDTFHNFHFGVRVIIRRIGFEVVQSAPYNAKAE